MDEINALLKQNRAWADEREEKEPGSFARLAKGQSPEYLWIGCIDSRMPAEQLTGLEPGQMLVYRNIANLVNPADKSCMSAIQFAVEVLKVKNIIVTGHTNCGGVAAALKKEADGTLEEWLTPLHELCDHHSEQLESLPNESEQAERLCELSIEQQVLNVADNPVVQKAWKNGQQLSIHGCVYDVATGELRSLGIRVSNSN
ncbi:carbonic anhydrase [Parendozoicomonas sp. Alg238-R29]|uniref:carbonic anhydrase n=1 Tax=Parendozoicomonas sp. Alg238-R29 TaxID=2993446 RepID=UPI00248DC968|nr:carbonic anhydrase [Parendozoicomonas sp. Alg238-R29]